MFRKNVDFFFQHKWKICSAHKTFLFEIQNVIKERKINEAYPYGSEKVKSLQTRAGITMNERQFYMFDEHNSCKMEHYTKKSKL